MSYNISFVRRIKKHHVSNNILFNIYLSYIYTVYYK